MPRNISSISGEFDMNQDIRQNAPEAGEPAAPKPKRDPRHISRQLLDKELDSLTPTERVVVDHIAKRRHISRNVLKEHEAKLTFGERLADRVAAFGGSWPFIILFLGLLLFWVILNSFILIRWKGDFDPYPYILLNLVLSMIASIQAPVIMMSQNRHSEKDRLDAAHDYEVNLKAELEILSLHRKLDAVREEQLNALLKAQQEQGALLASVLDELRGFKAKKEGQEAKD